MASILFIWVLIIAMTFFIVFFNADAMRQKVSTLQDITIDSTSDCVVANEKLIKIDTSSDICCHSSSNLTGAYYVSLNGKGMSVTSQPRYYLDVCKEYCRLGYTTDSTGAVTCVNDSAATLNVNACISSLKPVGCNSPALPIATLGAVPYYAYHVQSSVGIAFCTIGSCDI